MMRTTNLPRALTALIGAIGLLFALCGQSTDMITGVGVVLLAMAVLVSLVYPNIKVVTPGERIVSPRPAIHKDTFGPECECGHGRWYHKVGARDCGYGNCYCEIFIPTPEKAGVRA